MLYAMIIHVLINMCVVFIQQLKYIKMKAKY